MMLGDVELFESLVKVLNETSCDYNGAVVELI